MKFSERLGFKPVREQLLVDSVTTDLVNSLWSICYSFLSQPRDYGINIQFWNVFGTRLWLDYFKWPIDTIPKIVDSAVSESQLKKIIRDYFFDSKRVWYEYYDLLEFFAPFGSSEFTNRINKVLETEKSAYRFINHQFVSIISENEITSIEEALNSSSSKFQSVNTHLNTALKLLADREQPDYRNSIKESISSVESMCKIFVQDEKATLGKTLEMLEEEQKLHPALKKAFSALYGYTSDSSGIRHALTENNDSLTIHEARFMLVTCSAFVNLLISKIQ